MEASANVGGAYRCFDRAKAVRPEWVATTTSVAPRRWLTVFTASTSASVIGRTQPADNGSSAGAGAGGSSTTPTPASVPSSMASASAQMRLIIATVSTGYRPTAVSPESITASAPSRTALNTSVASARVGRDEVSMLLSICVAVITGSRARRHAAITRFCVAGTFATSISTPRSPRATIRPSATARIASRFATACGFSILAMIFTDRHPRRSSSALSRDTSEPCRTNDNPT